MAAILTFLAVAPAFHAVRTIAARHLPKNEEWIPFFRRLFSMAREAGMLLVVFTFLDYIFAQDPQPPPTIAKLLAFGFFLASTGVFLDPDKDNHP